MLLLVLQFGFLIWILFVSVIIQIMSCPMHCGHMRFGILKLCLCKFVWHRLSVVMSILCAERVLYFMSDTIENEMAVHLKRLAMNTF